jgi:argininosuccinate synthase
VRDELARAAFTGPLLRDAPGDEGYPRIDQWPRPLIARALLEIARIEGARSVAYGSFDHALDAEIAVIHPAVAVLSPSRGIALPDRSNRGYRVDENLWGRLVSWQLEEEAPSVVRPASTMSTERVRLDIGVEHGVPVSINGVPMSPAELVESLALIAGRHGVGRFECSEGGRRIVCDAPAAVVLRTALAAAGEIGVARLEVVNGTCVLAHSTVSDDNPSSSSDPAVELVSQA